MHAQAFDVGVVFASIAPWGVERPAPRWSNTTTR
jgi:hypothetical protein